MRLLLLLLLGLWSGPLLAEPIQPSEQIATTLATLFLVVALIVGLAVLAKRMNLPTKMSGDIRLLASLPLGAKDKVAVIEVGEQQYLIGVSANGITLLDKMQDKIDGPQPADFSKVFAGLKKQQSASASEERS